MCNILKRNMKSSFFSTIYSLFFLIVLNSCSNPSDSFENLDRAISYRNTNELVNHAKNGSTFIREQAYRALHNTPIQTDSLLNLVLEKPTELGLFALQGQPLNPTQLKRLRDASSKELDSYPNELYSVFSKQSDEVTYSWLLNKWNSQKSDASTDLVFAISYQSLKFGFPDSLLDDWIKSATSSTEEKLFRAYLYGFYRTRNTIIKNPHDVSLYSFLINNDETLSPFSKQLIVNILSRNASYDLLKWMAEQDIAQLDVTLQIEMAKALKKYLFSDLHNQIAVKFLQSSNELVLLTFFQNVSSAMAWNTDVKKALNQVLNNYRDPFHPVALAIQEFAYKAFKVQPIFGKESIKFAYISNPYSIPNIFSFSSEAFKPKEEVEMISEIWPEINISAFVSLSDRVVSLLNQMTQKEASIFKPFITQLIKERDRAVLINLNSLLSDKKTMPLIDVEVLLSTIYTELDPIADIEVFQTYIPFIVKDDSELAQKIVKKLSEASYIPIEKSLRDAGFKGNTDVTPVSIAVPNRKSLASLGMTPIWRLETEKGLIEMELDVERNPTTVWLIDSLSRAGLLNNVPFHRVVANFVVQGGDFERKDGYGGSSTTIPTEASELEFERGALGMASAGKDTESGQYFIMHQWAPHLNGRYTRFGMVQKGMDVVDKLIVGDMVINSSISAK